MSAAPLWLTAVTGLSSAAALASLQAEGHVTIDALLAIAEAALHQAEQEPNIAAKWLDVGDELATYLSTNAPLPASATAALVYARARLALFAGALAQAEELLRQAQAGWQQADEPAWTTRSWLGLTQVLAMQGRYAEAETAATQAVETWQRTPPTTFAQHLAEANALHNLATLFAYTERHAQALATFVQGHQRLTALQANATTDEEQAILTTELAHNDLNRATALTFLDQPEAAESALLAAEAGFASLADQTDQGRAQTNRGRLYLRTGRYHEALTTFDRAWTNLVPTGITQSTLDLAALRQADELLLEQAMAYLMMNLIPEARQALAHSQTLFQSAGQPYELGQTHYTAGLLALRTGEWQQAAEQLASAQQLFTDLNNEFWLARTQLALAVLAQRQGNLPLAEQRLAGLLDETNIETTAPLRWDLAGLAEAQLLRLQLAIEQGDLTAARIYAATLATFIGASQAPLADPGPLPHYTLRLHHALGQLARATGETAQARAHFETAIALLEATRATLSVEEVRTAFVEDKTAIYEDLVQLLLDLADAPLALRPATEITPASEATPPTDELLAAAFAIVEQARSRTLLERLLAALGEETTPDSEAEGEAATGEEGAQIELVRRRLHWLYNQLLGETGSRRLDPQLSQDLLAHEAALQRLEWRRAGLWQQAQGVDLVTFQQGLAADQQALLYTVIGSELAAFLVDQKTITVYRGLADMADVREAMGELRFQLGRAEVGGDYVARHNQRLQARLREALATLYRLIIARLAPHLQATRLLVIPVAELHRLPFHALWDGEAYLLERFEFSYAPSASVATWRGHNGYQPETAAQSRPKTWRTWAGLAVDDPAIPAARQEVERAASHFTQAQLFVGERAGRSALAQAAQADVLHLATHGLFRPDNPFFSALKLADGWVDVRELYRLPLAARLVVLSACESGVGGIRGGDEVVGLARGFLGAGAAELVASLWNVHDSSAADLMEHFYHFLVGSQTTPGQGCRPAAALRAAQQAACAAGLHPYYWAAFFVIGE